MPAETEQERLVREHKERINTQRRRDAHKAARVAADKVRSDPFIYGRVFTHMMNDIGREHDFGDA